MAEHSEPSGDDPSSQQSPTGPTPRGAGPDRVEEPADAASENGANASSPHSQRDDHTADGTAANKPADTDEEAGLTGFGGSPPPQFSLSTGEGAPHAQWLAEQLANYTRWYATDGVKFSAVSATLQITGTVTGLFATILAAAPEKYKDYEIGHVPWNWAIAILTAITTVLAGALPAMLRLARDREEGRIEMVRLRQELDILKGGPNLDTYLGAKTIIDRIAALERSYGGWRPSQ